jgi:hypothetical protein
MLTESPAGSPWPPPLAGRVPEGAGADQVAHAVATVWLEIDLVLHPVIGHRGVSALFDRSLKLAAAAHPWLLTDHLAVSAKLDPAVLRAAFSMQTAT